jgi:hypothetical protein
MDVLRMRCPYCQVGLEFQSNFQGRAGKCPKCQMPITFQGAPVLPTVGPPVAPPAAVMPPPLAPAAAPAMPPPAPPLGREASGEPQYPERMKANRALAGRVCPGCQKEIDLGDDVFNCPQCRATMHLACHEAGGGCAGCQPPVAPPLPPLAGIQPAGIPLAGIPPLMAEAAEDTRPRVPCRFCSELIPQGAALCGFCGEYQNESARVLQQLTVAKASGDDKMNVWEILLCVLCGGIGCIVGIVYAVQGKKKGWKMILLAIAVGVVWTIIRLIMAGALQH